MAQLLASDKTAVGQSLMQCQYGSTVSRRERPLLAESGPYYRRIFGFKRVRFGEKRTLRY